MRLLLAIVLLGAACERPNPAFVNRPADAAPAPDFGRDAPGAPGPDARVSDAPVPVDASEPDLILDVDAPPPADLTPADGVPASALLGHWTFEEDTNDPMVLDRSGNGHVARIENLELATARVPGPRGKALSFPATAVNPGAMVPVTSSPIRSLQQFTIAAWVYRPSIDDDEESGIISRQIGTGPRQVFNLAFQDDELVITMSQPTGSEILTAAAGAVKTPVARWFHIAATWNGRELTLYQNGQPLQAVAAPGWSLPDTANPLYLGTNKNMNNDEPLVGMLDEVRLYSIALTGPQIAALAADQVP